MLPTIKTEAESISKDQEEEMSSALIAQLLAEDAMGGGHVGDYYAEYSNEAPEYDPYQTQHNGDDSYNDASEDEFNPKKKPHVKKDAKKSYKRKAAPTKEEKKVKVRKAVLETNKGTAANDESIVNAQDSLQSSTATTIEQPASRKPRKALSEGCNIGTYTEEEEKRFIEGLELFGRDWQKLQAHVATRDSNSIRSHAQKHFIKMYRDQVTLPDKVRISGEGYTLSGKPLDPNSSAAKPYLSRASATTSDKLNGKKVIKTMGAFTANVDDPMDGIVEEARNKEDKSAVENKIEVPFNTQSTAAVVALDTVTKTDDITKAMEKQTELLSITDKNISINEVKKKTKPATPSPSNSSSTADSLYDSRGRTDYSSSRLRSKRAQGSVNYGQLHNDDDPLTMIKCEPFTGKPGSFALGSQPFTIIVHSNTLLAMDFHAHLMTTEIIGFLAGEFDVFSKKMTICEAFPCRSLETGQNETNVEMDPTSAIETRQLIEDKGLQVVGWYHSHPTFIPDPSLVDIENQRNYQMLCRRGGEKENNHDGSQDAEGTKDEPFVGAIVGPYDPALPGSASVINWFHVANSSSNRPIPKKLVYELLESESLSNDQVERLFELLSAYKNSTEKVVFAEHWRQDATESKLQKMIKSLGSRMPWIQKKLKANPTSAMEDVFFARLQSGLKNW